MIQQSENTWNREQRKIADLKKMPKGILGITQE